MPALHQDVTLYQSDDLAIYVPIRDDDGNPVDLSGGEARWCLAEATPAGDLRVAGQVYVSKEMGGGVSIYEDTGLYTVEVRIVPADTVSLSPGLYYHELEVIDADNKAATVTTGRLYLKPTAIRP